MSRIGRLPVAIPAGVEDQKESALQKLKRAKTKRRLKENETSRLKRTKRNTAGQEAYFKPWIFSPVP